MVNMRTAGTCHGFAMPLGAPLTEPVSPPKAFPIRGRRKQIEVIHNPELSSVLDHLTGAEQRHLSVMLECRTRVPLPLAWLHGQENVELAAAIGAYCESNLLAG